MLIVSLNGHGSIRKVPRHETLTASAPAMDCFSWIALARAARTLSGIRNALGRACSSTNCLPVACCRSRAFILGHLGAEVDADSGTYRVPNAHAS